MVSSGFGSLQRIDASLVGEYANLTLAQVGLHPGDIVSSGNRHRHIHLPIAEAA
jgi:hypothetical protein